MTLRATDVAVKPVVTDGHLPGEWWRDAVIYQIYPPSFVDATGDGVGDLPGITARLGYVKSLGVDAIWLSPFYCSPQADGGYDVADYCDVDPLFGTLADFDGLVTRAHALGLQVIVDVVPNHTSSEHAWFRAALAVEPDSAERARYHFRPGRGANGDEPPNNWQSLFGGPAWTPVDSITGRPGDAGQWYLHLFDSRQPDLNWDCADVRSDFEDILRFWLDRGVDGFRVDVAHGMVKAAGLPDHQGHVGAGAPGEATSDTGPMFDQDGVHDIYRSWNKVLASYDGDRALIAEACVEPPERVARYLRTGEMQQALNFLYLETRWDARELREAISESLRANDSVGAPTTWVLSNHDVVRHASRLGLAHTGRAPEGIGAQDEQPDARLGLQRARAAALLTLALPGSAYLYQGEELGLPEHTTLADELRRDPVWLRSGKTRRGRDGCRVPIPWSADQAAFGFSPNGEAWLPQPPEWSRIAVDSQDGVFASTLELYRRALRTRRIHRLGSGRLDWLEPPAGPGEDSIAFRNGHVLVVVNFAAVPMPLPAGAEVLLASDDLVVDDVGGISLATDTAAWLRGTRWS